MAKTLRVPDELRFVEAFALTVDPGNTLDLLMEISAMGSPDPSAALRTGVGILRRTREALVPACDRASDLKDWEQAHPIGVLREALVPACDRASDLKDWEQAHPIGVLREALTQSDSASFLAYRVRDNHRSEHTATEASSVSSTEPYAEALAVVGCASDGPSSRRRPWAIEPNDLSLPEWRERVWKLLFAMPDNALPKPSEQLARGAAPCTCSEADSPKALTHEHAGWCPDGEQSRGRSDES